MTPFTAEDYAKVHWPLLRDTLDMLFTLPPGSYKPISYEQMYTAVYKCVCRGFGEHLYRDLAAHTALRVDAWRADLAGLAEGREFVLRLHAHLGQFLVALESVVPIFTYLNRFYLEAKLQTELNTELLLIFTRKLGDEAVPKAIDILCQMEATPFSIPPEVRQGMLKNISTLDQKYVDLRAALFCKYIPGIRVPMCEADLVRQAEEDRKLQEDLRRSGFGPGDQSKKRGLLDEGDEEEAEDKRGDFKVPAPGQRMAMPLDDD